MMPQPGPWIRSQPSPKRRPTRRRMREMCALWRRGETAKRRPTRRRMRETCALRRSGEGRCWPGGRTRGLVLCVSPGEDRGDEVEHVGRADLAVAVVLDHPVLDDVDLLLR